MKLGPTRTVFFGLFLFFAFFSRFFLLGGCLLFVAARSSESRSLLRAISLPFRSLVWGSALAMRFVSLLGRFVVNKTGVLFIFSDHPYVGLRYVFSRLVLRGNVVLFGVVR